MIRTVAILCIFVVVVYSQHDLGFGSAMLRLGQPIRKLGDVFLVPVFEPVPEGNQDISTNEIDTPNTQVPAVYARHIHVISGNYDGSFQPQYPTRQKYDQQYEMNSLGRQRRSPGTIYNGNLNDGVGYVPQGGIGHGGGGGVSQSSSQAQASSSSTSGSTGHGGGGIGYGR